MKVSLIKARLISPTTLWSISAVSSFALGFLTQDLISLLSQPTIKAPSIASIQEIVDPGNLANTDNHKPILIASLR